MKSDRTRIGMFDSGIGGLSVLHEALKSLPGPEYLYYADTEHVPYGTKRTDEIRQYTDEIITFLTREGAEAVIIACNTATSAAVSLMREKYDIPIIGMEPAVKPALLLTGEHGQDEGADDTVADQNTEQTGTRVLVMATPLTLRESKLEALIARYDSHHLVDKLPAEGLVHFAESDAFDEEKILSYLEEILIPYDRRAYGAVVLGCTHFNYFLPELKKVFPESTHFVDGVRGTLRRTADLLGLRFLEEEEKKTKAHVRYFFSGKEVTDEKSLLRIARLQERLDLCDAL